MDAPEPNLDRGEIALQEAVVAQCRRILEAAGARYILLEGFGLDVAIWVVRDTLVEVKFLEMKVFTGARRGGVGFGNGQGKGPQVDLLLVDEPSLGILDQSVRWILGDATLPDGSARFALVPSDAAKASAMGGVARGKQNNFRIKELVRCAIDWLTFCEQLGRFLLG